MSIPSKFDYIHTINELKQDVFNLKDNIAHRENVINDLREQLNHMTRSKFSIKEVIIERVDYIEVLQIVSTNQTPDGISIMVTL